VVLLEIPSRNELRVKNLFNVADCKMHWQKSGDYLCVKVSCALYGLITVAETVVFFAALTIALNFFNWFKINILYFIV
jgi:hypothetical protein